MTTYPTLRLGVLQSLVELRAQFEHRGTALFDAAECPYDRETVTALGQIFSVKYIETVVEKVIEVSPKRDVDTKMTMADQEEVAESARDLLKQLQELGEGERTLDTQTKIQIIRTKATLIEQLLKLRERWLNVKRMATFQAVVISVLDDLLDEDRRSEFLRRIDPYRE